MPRKFAFLVAIVFSVLSTSSAFATSPSIFWSDVYVSYRNLWQDKQPGFPQNITENAINISYANAWTYGSNFVSLDLESFAGHDQGNSCQFQPASCHPTSGSAELYAVFRTVFSGNKISGTKDFSWGPIADIGWEVGMDFDTQNDQFASYKKLLTFGPQIAIAMPKGFWTISFHASHEWNTDAFIPNGNGTNYDWAPELETAWLYPFNIGPVGLKFTGYLNVIGPKGSGASGDFDHRLEILAHPKLLVDVGSLIGFETNKVDAGVGYEYWLNKFGSYNYYVGGGSQQNAVFVEAGYHFSP